ncbi:hypothetical protein [Nonomuraea sp. KM90]|uniref:hypothetical protein n=1 Tax=Nonomuraea sp. KM90 TaxID=3457428 RepID=UPI003FCD182E
MNATALNSSHPDAPHHPTHATVCPPDPLSVPAEASLAAARALRTALAEHGMDAAITFRDADPRLHIERFGNRRNGSGHEAFAAGLPPERTSALSRPVRTLVRGLNRYDNRRVLCAPRIPDRLAEGPTTIEDLHTWCRQARQARRPQDGRLDLTLPDLARLLGIRQSQEWADKTPAAFYWLTCLGHLLTCGPESMPAAVLLYALPFWRKPLATMADTVRTGVPVAVTGAVDDLGVDAPTGRGKRAAAFHAGRSATLAATLAATVADAIGSNLRHTICHVVTIGGTAVLLADLLHRLPLVSGVLVDAREPDAAARQPASADALAGRWAVTVGRGVNAGIPMLQFRALYLICGVINTMPEHDAQRLLTQVATAMDLSGPHSIVWLVQSVVPDEAEPHPAFAHDLPAMTRTRHGRERRVGEYAALLREAGLRLVGIIATGEQTIITASTRSHPLTPDGRDAPAARAVALLTSTTSAMSSRPFQRSGSPASYDQHHWARRGHTAVPQPDPRASHRCDHRGGTSVGRGALRLLRSGHRGPAEPVTRDHSRGRLLVPRHLASAPPAVRQPWQAAARGPRPGLDRPAPRWRLEPDICRAQPAHRR